ncbi:MAG: formyl transferase [bacterium]|nr:formyl transferase [bacterium]
MKRIVIFTGSELRHDFVRKFIAIDPEIMVAASFCEGAEKGYRAFVEKQTDTEMRMKHLIAREQSEKDFFGLFVEDSADKSNPLFLAKGDINKPQYFDQVVSLKPDLIIAFGCSIIKEPLLSAFSGRFLNVHLGLSPYYRGSGTNYWPLVNGEPEFVGATFMHIDPGIDTGEIIHQIRAEIVWGDTPSSIGNRLIKDMTSVYREIIKKIDHLPKMPQPEKFSGREYRQRDYDEMSVQNLYTHFNNGLVEIYLKEKRGRCLKAPLVSNSGLL